MVTSVVAVCAGASLGALLRWGLSLLFNAVFPPVPLGTLAANLLGGYCIGLALGLFSACPGLAPEWRLLVVTGFLGALTTFSTFSAEVCIHLQQNRLLLAAAIIALHVCGSLLMTFLGMGSFTLMARVLRP